MPEEPLVRPEHGARVLVRLATAPAGDASYALVLATATGVWEASASVRESDGHVEARGWTPEEPPAWLAQATHALLRSAWQRRRAGSPWPRRLARWRPSPDDAAT